MALISCHECENQVSDTTRACSKCGAPVIVRIQREQKVSLIVAEFYSAIITLLANLGKIKN
jgi:hypothetical protein